MRNITYTASFYKNNSKLYDAVLFAGNVGIYTGLKAEKFSISENQRFPNYDIKGMIKNIYMVFTG
jgi:hypothetical protein